MADDAAIRADVRTGAGADGSAQTEASPTLPRLSLSRLPTGAKLLLVLSAALLPLALIAIFATLQTTRLTDSEARSRLRIAATESARSIAIELVGDMTALRVAVNALDIDPADAPSCARAQGVFAQQASVGARFEIADRMGHVLCGERLPRSTAVATDAGPTASIVPNRGLVLAISAPRKDVVARAFFPQDFLRELGQPTSRATTFASALILDDDALDLEPLPDGGPLQRMETMRTELGIAGLALRTSVRSAPLTSSMVVAMLLPLLMWAAAAWIGWFVVDRLLLRPLRDLRREIASFKPGEEVPVPPPSRLPAQEIRELGETFRTISRTVAEHEAGLEEGLRRQTKLTREVHHRVKNNLQVIASLIAFHARGAASADATAAYAAIQRRVDALAVVHRHHFAELEEHRGLNLRTMIGELASNLRATSEAGSGVAIKLDVDPYLVNQDVAVAVAFLFTEIVELAFACDTAAQIRVSVKVSEQEDRATLRVVSRALLDGDTLRELARSRYGRILEGLSRQLRSPLHHDPLTGAYEIAIAVVGRE